MPEPAPRSFLGRPNNQAWLHDMQGYFGHGGGPDSGRKFPNMGSAEYDMGAVDEDSVSRILIALFGGDELAAKKYLRGEDPFNMMKPGGDALPPPRPPRPPMSPVDPLIDEAEKLSRRKY
ncbi:MAG: hypothetical protein KJ899_15450 [Gammaproteobacteria bacterium]|nr:hypothetical protein [Gammaproteobacteria bacterium]